MGFLCADSWNLPEYQQDYQIGLQQRNLSAILDTNRVWDVEKYPIIKVGFIGVSPENKKIIQKTVQNGIERYLYRKKINFEWDVELKDSYIRISTIETALSTSMVGTDCLLRSKDKATMNLSHINDNDILHEFGHALGLHHEHYNLSNRPFTWNTQVVYKIYEGYGWTKKMVDAFVFQTYGDSEMCKKQKFKCISTGFNASNFDRDSIMIYPISAEMTNEGYSTENTVKLSRADKIWLNKYYGDPNYYRYSYIIEYQYHIILFTILLSIIFLIKRYGIIIPFYKAKWN